MKLEISQANGDHFEDNAEDLQAGNQRGIDQRVKKIIKDHYLQNIRSIQTIGYLTGSTQKELFLLSRKRR